MDDATRSRLAKLRAECGCTAGSLALLFSVAAYVSYALWLDPASRGAGERIAVGAGLAFCSALAGKALGILWARLQYRRLLRLQIAD
jgi:hypothetical protein